MPEKHPLQKCWQKTNFLSGRSRANTDCDHEGCMPLGVPKKLFGETERLFTIDYFRRKCKRKCLNFYYKTMLCERYYVNL